MRRADATSGYRGQSSLGSERPLPARRSVSARAPRCDGFSSSCDAGGIGGRDITGPLRRGCTVGSGA